MPWEPNAAPLAVEEAMEAKDVVEEDRDEVRRFAEFLQRRKDKKEGKDVGPLTNEMKDWLTGEK